MRIFNQEKTRELNPNSIDFSKGYLVNDKLFIQHHNPVYAVEEQGHYQIVKEYPNGGQDVKWIVDIPAVEAQDAYDEYEDVQVYVPYTVEQLKDILRARRAKLLTAFDKWEKAVLRGREKDDFVIMTWYQNLLNLNEIAFENIPDRIKYYM